MRLVLAASAAVLSFSAATAQAQSIADTAAQLRDRAMAGSAAFPVLESLTTEIGARPAGSPAQKRAMEWGVAKLSALDETRERELFGALVVSLIERRA